jgi:hypothetical protein
MIEENQHADASVLSLTVSGKLSGDDLDNLTSTLQEYTSEYSDPHLLMILEDFHGWESAGALWKDLKMDAEYIGYFDRIAVVGDKEWEKWGTQLLNPITREDLRYFDKTHFKQALNWISKTH